MGLVDKAEDIVLLGLVVVIGYYAYKGAAAVGSAATTLGSAAGQLGTDAYNYEPSWWTNFWGYAAPPGSGLDAAGQQADNTANLSNTMQTLRAAQNGSADVGASDPGGN
jgi:hypothetical protein